jgi:hypothetical protein
MLPPWALPAGLGYDCVLVFGHCEGFYAIGVQIPEDRHRSLVHKYAVSFKRYEIRGLGVWAATAIVIGATEMRSMGENDFECLASTGVNTPVTMSPNSMP